MCIRDRYNTADSLIVGNFLGSNALAAVSSSGNLIFLMIGFFNGIALGAGVVIARYFGARQYDKLQDAMHTTVAVSYTHLTTLYLGGGTPTSLTIAQMEVLLECLGEYSADVEEYTVEANVE